MPTRMAKRTTADGKIITLWSDGALTQVMGCKIRGVSPTRKPPFPHFDVTVGWLVLGEVEIADFVELPRMIKTARRMVRKAYPKRVLPGELRAALWGKPKPQPKPKPKARTRAKAPRSRWRPTWTITAMDARGKTTSREWRIPRMMGAGELVVIDEQHPQGRYTVYDVRRGASGGFYEAGMPPSGRRRPYLTFSGFRFKNLKGLFAYLDERAELQKRR